MSKDDRTYSSVYYDGFLAGYKLAKEIQESSKTPDRFYKGCRVCGIGEGNEILGYVCSRKDCPTKFTSTSI
jgi:hypothetical protein